MPFASQWFFDASEIAVFDRFLQFAPHAGWLFGAAAASADSAAAA